MNHTVALNILRNSVDDLTLQITTTEAQIAQRVYQLEELKLTQQELIESIKHLGATDERQNVGPIAIA